MELLVEPKPAGLEKVAPLRLPAGA